MLAFDFMSSTNNFHIHFSDLHALNTKPLLQTDNQAFEKPLVPRSLLKINLTNSMAIREAFSLNLMGVPT